MAEEAGSRGRLALHELEHGMESVTVGQGDSSLSNVPGLKTRLRS